MILRYNFFTIVWGILIVVYTLSPAGSHTVQIYGSNFDKVAHVMLFFVFEFLLIIGLTKQYTSTYVRFNAVKVSLIFSNIFGLIVECGQFFDPIRGFEPWDILANFIGATIAVILFYILYKI